MITVFLECVEISNGKKILLIAPEEFDALDTEMLMDFLRDKFPEVEWAILVGGFRVQVMEDEDNERHFPYIES